MWDLENKTHKQAKPKPDLEVRRTNRWLPDGRGDKGEGVGKYKSGVTEESWERVSSTAQGMGLVLL